MSETDAFDRVVERERKHHEGRHARRAKRVLRAHAWIWLVVNAALIATWIAELAVFDGDHPAWWLPVALGWGVGLLAHAIAVRRLAPR